MYIITKIEEQKKDTDRYSVFINDVFDFGITKKACQRYELKEGMVLSQEAYESLLGRLQLDKAKYKALDYLASHAKTEKQVRDKLQKYEYSEYIIEEVITFLKEYHYIDDDDFAKRYIYHKAQYNKKSIKQIKSQLYMKGITRVDLSEDSEAIEVMEEENVTYFLVKYHYSTKMDYAQKSKIIKRLLNKGFSYSIIQKSIGKIDESFDI